MNLDKEEGKQIEIANWFDETYKVKEFKYLRPIEAYEIFLTILNPKKNQTHLDIACGLGLLLRVLNNNGVDSFGIDISTVAVDKAKALNPESQIRQSNAEELPYEDKTFDSVSCIGSIERMLDREKVLQEQYRVGKENARYLFMVRNSNHWLWKYIQKPFGLYNKDGHQDAMNKEEWTALFRANGFEIAGVYPDHWPFLKVMSTLLPFVKWNYSRLRKFPRPVHTAYELIFLLQKS